MGVGGAFLVGIAFMVFGIVRIPRDRKRLREYLASADPIRRAQPWSWRELLFPRDEVRLSQSILGDWVFLWLGGLLVAALLYGQLVPAN